MVIGVIGIIGNSFFNFSVGVVGIMINFNGFVFVMIISVSGIGIVNFNGNVIGVFVYIGDGFINFGVGWMLIGVIIINIVNIGMLILNGGSSVIGVIGGVNGLK